MSSIVMTPRKQETLKKAHTRQLKKWLDSARACGGSFDVWSGMTFTVDELKAELALRPHIPNKEESKLMRQQKARVAQGKRKK